MHRVGHISYRDERGDNAQHENDAGAIAGFSNQLTSAQGQIASCNGTILTLSNRLDESLSASLTLSNHLIEAESTIVLDTEQITNLNRHVAEMESENQTLGRRVMDLTKPSGRPHEPNCFDRGQSESGK